MTRPSALVAGGGRVPVEVIISWAGWLLAGIRAEAPLIVGLAAMWLTIFLIFPATAFVQRVGQPRLAIYLAYALFHSAIVGVFFLIALLEEATGQAWAVERLLIYLRLWVWGDELGVIAGYSALLFVVFTAIGGVSDWISDAVGETPTSTAIEMRPRTIAERFVWVSVMSPAAGFFEEVIFRGALLGFAIGLSGDPVIAVALTSLLFGLVHAGYGLTWTIGSSVMGVAAAVCVLASGSLWPAIIAHALYDMTVYFIFEGGAPAGEDVRAGKGAPVWLRRLISPVRSRVRGDACVRCSISRTRCPRR